MSTPTAQYSDRATTQKELESYIFGGRYGRKSVPTRLDPTQVDEFIRQRLDRKKSVGAFSRSRRIVDYYDLHSVLDHYEKMLTRSEKDSREFDQSLQCIMTLAEAGTEAQSKKANEYFEYLVKHPLAPQSYGPLAEALEGLAPDANPTLLANRLVDSLKSLKPRIASSPEADDEYQRIDQLLNDNLPRSVSDEQLRRDVLAIADPQAKIEQLCRIYLGWGENDTTELTWWSGRWIRRQARETGLAMIAVAFRRVVDEIEASNLATEEKVPYQIRALRAIRFLGGELNAKEKRVLERAKSSQVDILDRESE